MNDLTKEQRQANSATHKTRYSDSSLYDEVCTVCGARDFSIGPDEIGNAPCPGHTRRVATSDWPKSTQELRAERDALRDQLEQANTRCICAGNWQRIVEKYEPLIGQYFKCDRNGEVYH